MATTPRALRGDAARNRELLLDAAEAEFAAHGEQASVADIAARAGVAKGTVFRHFATKEELMAAIVVEHLATLAARAEELVGTDDPAAALLALLEVVAEDHRQRDLRFVQSMSVAHPRAIAQRDRLVAALEALVAEAQAAGQLRRDVTGTDIFLLTCAPVHVVEYLPAPAPDQWRRYLALIFDGLRPEGASALPVAAPALPDLG